MGLQIFITKHFTRALPCGSGQWACYKCGDSRSDELLGDFPPAVCFGCMEMLGGKSREDSFIEYKTALCGRVLVMQEITWKHLLIETILKSAIK